MVARLAGVDTMESWGQNVVVREKGSLVVASLGSYRNTQEGYKMCTKGGLEVPNKT